MTLSPLPSTDPPNDSPAGDAPAPSPVDQYMAGWTVAVGQMYLGVSYIETYQGLDVAADPRFAAFWIDMARTCAGNAIAALCAEIVPPDARELHDVSRRSFTEHLDALEAIRAAIDAGDHTAREQAEAMMRAVRARNSSTDEQIADMTARVCDA